MDSPGAKDTKSRAQKMLAELGKTRNEMENLGVIIKPLMPLRIIANELQKIEKDEEDQKEREKEKEELMKRREKRAKEIEEKKVKIGYKGGFEDLSSEEINPSDEAIAKEMIKIAIGISKSKRMKALGRNFQVIREREMKEKEIQTNERKRSRGKEKIERN